MQRFILNSRLSPIMLLFSALILAACSNESHNDSKALSGVTEAGTESTQDTQTATLEYQFGKPGAPISLTYEAPKNATAGSLIDVAITLNSATKGGQLKLDLNADPGLNLLSARAAEFDLAQQPITLIAQLFIEQEGSFYLNLSIQESDTSGVALMGRSFAIPIQVGAVAANMKINGRMVDDGEEKIIEMIAQ